MQRIISEREWRMRHYAMRQICISSRYVKMIIFVIKLLLINEVIEALKLCSIEDTDIYYILVIFCKLVKKSSPVTVWYIRRIGIKNKQTTKNKNKNKIMK